jgi:hypothetical protein
MIKIAQPANTPYIPDIPDNTEIPNLQSLRALARSLFGKTNPQIPAVDTIINDAGEIKPASTAALPTTIPPITETDWPLACGRCTPDS